MKILQQDFQAATVSLEESTSAIHRQSEILKNQRQYVDSLKRQRTDESKPSRKTRLAIQNLTLAVREMLLVPSL